MPGQNGEDRIILDYLNGVADDYPHRFLDVGGYDPVVFSNTRILAEAGWSGVYVEPAPGNFNSFLKEYHDNDKLLLVNAAVAEESKLIDFWDSGGDAVSSAVPDHVLKWTVGHIKFRHYLTKTITWAELLDAMKVHEDPISVLSLDVEAMNSELFQLLPIGLLLPQLRVFIVEHDGQHDNMEKALIPYGFRKHHFNGENIIFVR